MLKFHHIGLLVEDLNFSIQQYTLLFGEKNMSKVYNINSQEVSVCFVKIGDNNYIELVQPQGENSIVSKLLKKRTSYYHMGYKVSDILDTVSKLESLNYKILNFFNSEAFNGKKCVFLFSPEAHLIELIEE